LKTGVQPHPETSCITMYLRQATVSNVIFAKSLNQCHSALSIEHNKQRRLAVWGFGEMMDKAGNTHTHGFLLQHKFIIHARKKRVLEFQMC